MSLYLAAYDISHPSQRAKVARELLEFGRRIQRSVFEVELEPEELPALQRRVGALLGKRDAFDLVPIDQRAARARLSWQRPPQGGAPVVLL